MTLTNETRLEQLRASALLDTLPEKQFDRLTRLTARLLGTPVALISLVDGRRQFFKSQIGLPEPWATTREAPLSHSFCQYVVTGSEALVVNDSRSDERVEGNLGIPELGIAAYCGVPLRTESGAVLGSLCAIDSQPREWTDDDIQILTDLSEVVMTEVELRTALNKERELRAEKYEVVRTLQNALLPPVLPTIPGVELAAAYLPEGVGNVVGGDFYDVFQGRDDRWNVVVGDVCGKGVQSARTSILVRHVMNAGALRAESVPDTFRIVDAALRQHEHPFVAVSLLSFEVGEDSVDATINLAGQPRAIVIRKSGIEVRGTYGIVLGIGVDAEQAFDEDRFTLTKGDVVVMFTDGVTDAPSQVITEVQIAEELAKHPPANANEAVDRIVKLAHDFAGSIRTPTDDIAVVALGIK